MATKTYIRYIWWDDLQSYLQAAEKVKRTDADGREFVYVSEIDKTIEIQKRPTPAERLNDLIDKREAKLAKMTEPDTEELKQFHPYYETKDEIERLKSELEKYG